MLLVNASSVVRKDVRLHLDEVGRIDDKSVGCAGRELDTIVEDFRVLAFQRDVDGAFEFHENRVWIISAE